MPISAEIRKFSQPVYLMPPITGFLVEFCESDGTPKTTGRANKSSPLQSCW